MRFICSFGAGDSPANEACCPAIKKRNTINVTDFDFEVVNIPYTDSAFSATSVIELRRDRLRETKI